MYIGSKRTFFPGAFAATDMNDHSSRSHVIFTITVECSELGPDKQQHVRMGKLHLVDLAVRECVCDCSASVNGKAYDYVPSWQTCDG